MESGHRRMFTVLDRSLIGLAVFVVMILLGLQMVRNG